MTLDFSRCRLPPFRTSARRCRLAYLVLMVIEVKQRKPHSEATKAKIAAALIGKRHPPERCESNRRGQLGKIQTPEHKQAIRDGVKVAMHQPDIRKRHIDGLQEAFSHTEHGNNFTGGRGQPPSATTLAFAAVLCPAGYLMDEICILKGPGANAGHYTLDFGHPEAKVDIELDGSSHRGREERDAQRDALLRSLGWKIIRIKV